MFKKFIKPTNDDLEKMANDLDLKRKQNVKQDSYETDLFVIKIGDLWVESAPLLEYKFRYPFLTPDEIITTCQIGNAQKYSQEEACKVAKRFNGTVYQVLLIKK